MKMDLDLMKTALISALAIMTAAPALAERVAATGPTVHAHMAETVIGGPLLVIGQDRIGFGDFLEPGDGVLGAAIAVRVVLHGQLAIGRLQACGVNRPLNTQNFVIVTLRHQAFVLLPSRRDIDPFG